MLHLYIILKTFEPTTPILSTKYALSNDMRVMDEALVSGKMVLNSIT